MTPAETGRDELRRVMRPNRSLFWLVGLFSVFVNLLALTGPMFMLQVYDRVLGSRSEETLAALVILMAFLFAMMGILDFVRARVMSRLGARLQSDLDGRVFRAVVQKASILHKPDPNNALRDLESLQRYYASPGFLALYDLPFVPLFIGGIAIFHPWLGVLALVGGGLLVLLAVLNQIIAAPRLNRANLDMVAADRMANQIQSEAEMISALGMVDASRQRWSRVRVEALSETIAAGDVSGSFTVLTRTLRQFLQSAMLGLAALLVIRGEVTAGVMIAASILLGRALAPIETLIGQWPVVQRARRGRVTLERLLGEVPLEVQRTALPRPKAHLVINQLSMVPPGETQASLRMVSAELAPGQALGVIGPSGSGKSTLARAIAGVWRPAAGVIRLGGVALEQYSAEALGNHIGYLPQRVQLFEGTIAENIARLSLEPDDAAVVAAATKAGAHELILRLPEGYDTQVTSSGQLSGGEIQRIGLARAFYGNPVLLVLDEPNSNLDNEGTQALNLAVRSLKAQGSSVIIMAHRPAAIQECEMLMVLEGGVRRGYGPRDQLLREMVANHQAIAEASGKGGIT